MASTLVLACGALATELVAILRSNQLSEAVTVECLPASLHHTPSHIPDALRERLATSAGNYETTIVGYGDCGTVGGIDEVCREFGAERIPGEHCFEFFAGQELFAELQDAEVGTFYLTDFFARHFDLFVMEPLGINKHPELEAMYFGNYTKVVYLSQAATPDLVARAERAAQRLGLTFEHRPTGYSTLQTTVVALSPTQPS